MNLALTERLRYQHSAIPDIIEGLTEDQLYYSLAAGKWNIHDNIAHLACYQHIFTDRLTRILGDDTPVFERYNADNDPEFDVWQSRTTNVLLERINSDRKQIIDLLTQLSPLQTDRAGVHPKFGKLNILQWTEFFLLHEAHHIFTIFQLAHEPANK